MILQEKFKQLDTVLNVELIERETVIETQILALIARGHHFQIGEPGVAKSLSTRRLMAHIEGLTTDDYFETLITRFSNPEELFGPLDLLALRGLQNPVTGEVITPSKYQFQTEGYAPNAKIWFLDEIWKGNAGILNALLMALNERLFRNSGHMNTIPLSSMFCASNEMPEGEELNALYDRIDFRLIVRPIQEPGNFINMVKMKLKPEDTKIITWDEILQAQQEAAEVEVPTDVWEALQKVRSDLRAEGIEPTDRRFHDCGRIIRAAAWLEGETIADIHHMHPLAHVLWRDASEQAKVDRMLHEVANPLEKDVIDLLDTVKEIASQLDKIAAEKDLDPQAKNKRGVELHGKVTRAKKDLKKLIKVVDESGRKSKKIDDVKSLLVTCSHRLIDDVFEIDPDAEEEEDL